ncbi:YifB family Mg chelatase-like AAA ATPase [Marinomonas ostreistagni]|uniref:YifB family Mg chelatase-like AAA ATPase n=1 Tax=Marinomonas ostreistagni TaxID=359209 RepID=UPI0019504C38|nr:YifB family Mg chelatase-like AAA ATPase [Marinomonas ostreistagni]MBM6551111.1 YifB family Mg chelatase-like AAA ATPase [Marinomonas ostreistagni]
MSLATIYSRARVGVSAPLVTVEIHLSNGLPSLNIVGLPEAAVREAKDRVRSAIINSKFEFPLRRITVNLAPADLPKEGGRYDLAIAIGILVASEQLGEQQLGDMEFVGELALSGELRAIPGVLPSAMASKSAARTMICPYDNRNEAGLVDHEIYHARHLTQVTAHIIKQQALPRCAVEPDFSGTFDHHKDMQDVKGQYQARRALEVAAAGSHNLLFIGPPGTGKTMLASRLPGIMPKMTEDEALEVAAVQSVSGRKMGVDWHWSERPFRSPHHSSSAAALVGGGSIPKPGEASLSHRGVLFLDELPEFDRKVLEVLREPLENGEVHLSRARGQVSYPARFMLVAAMNASNEAYSGEQDYYQSSASQKYLRKLSAPFLDRIDLHVEVPPLPTDVLVNQTELGESSAAVRQRVEAAVARQRARQGVLNGQLNGRDLERTCALSDADKQFMQQALERLKLSARAYHRVLRVALTLADLEGKEVERKHLMESLSYRKMEKTLAAVVGGG